MTEAEESFYTRDRWQNWLTRVEEEDIEFDDEDSARLLWNMREDTAIAVAKIVAAYEDDRLSEEEAREKLEKVREIVLADVEFEDEERLMLVDDVQTSLLCVFYAAEEFVASDDVPEGAIEEFVHAAAESEAEEDMDAALGYLVQAGTRIIDGDTFDVDVLDDIEYGLVAVWVNGLDSLQSAMSDPEVVEEDG